MNIATVVACLIATGMGIGEAYADETNASAITKEQREEKLQRRHRITG